MTPRSVLHQLLSEPTHLQSSNQLDTKVRAEIRRWMQFRTPEANPVTDMYIQQHDWMADVDEVLTMPWCYKVMFILLVMTYSESYSNYLLQREHPAKADWIRSELPKLLFAWRAGLSVRYPAAPWNAEADEGLTRTITAQEFTVERFVRHVSHLWCQQ